MVNFLVAYIRSFTGDQQTTEIFIFHKPNLERFNWDLVWAGEEGRELLSGDFRPQKSLPSSKFQVTNLIVQLKSGEVKMRGTA